jgi:ribosomal protein S27E
MPLNSRMYYFKCPSCDNRSTFGRVQEDRRGMANAGCAMFALGGLIPWLIFADYHRDRVQCGKCGMIFHRPALPQSPVAKGVLWVFLLIVLSVGIGVVIAYAQEAVDLIPGSEYFHVVAEFVKHHSVPVAVAAMFLSVVLLPTLVVAACVSNIRFRRKLRSQHQVKPQEVITRVDSKGDA